ncbi:MAG TPA: RNA 2',3'-cyclic phosphodiesterase [Steroidobacteraceae bacterium]|nr:RNA 2',3'-cyclic phosphodiesterase [Steroidobacteraceae bacterium]
MATDEPPGEAVSGEPTRRLFFALWPDEAMREAMAEAIRGAARAWRGSDPVCGGRPVPARNLHVTLAFLGSVPERRRSKLAEVARGAAETASSALATASSPGNPLELVFDHLEHWRAARALCALPAEPPAPVAALARQLQDLLVGRGFAPDLKPFRPHVTVVRKVVSPGPIGKMHPVVWQFAELALIESRTLPEGALYSVVESYPLWSGINAANNSQTP